MSDRIICQTVAELIAALSALPPETRLMGTEPPFDHVAVVPQGVDSILLCTDGELRRAHSAKLHRPPSAGR